MNTMGTLKAAVHAQLARLQLPDVVVETQFEMGPDGRAVGVRVDVAFMEPDDAPSMDVVRNMRLFDRVRG